MVCEKKHMGSRAVVVLCRTPETASERFGINDGTIGIVYTRTGRKFFDQPDTERVVPDRLDKVLARTGF